MIYVDDAFISHKGRTWCHLMADSDEELEAFARKVGLRPEWKHNDHYDVTRIKRLAVVKAGAIEVKPEKIVEIRQKLRRAARVKQ